LRKLPQNKVRFGETPKPTPETDVLPSRKTRAYSIGDYLIRADA
jgi:hypothetical protein